MANEESNHARGMSSLRVRRCRRYPGLFDLRIEVRRAQIAAQVLIERDHPVTPGDRERIVPDPLRPFG